MEIKRAAELLRGLADGRDPITGARLPDESVYNHPEIIRALHKAGTTILLVEQNAQMALSVADRAYVLETGRIALSGTGKELAESDAIRKAYLGG